MPRKTQLQDRALEWIQRLPTGREFHNKEVYSYLAQAFPNECRARGDADKEPKFHNDARWAIQRAKREKSVRDTGTGRHKRL